MDGRDESSEVLSAVVFVAGLGMVLAGMFVSPGWIDAELIQPVRERLHRIGLAADPAEPGFMPLMMRTTRVRIVVLFVGALCVFDNLSLFRNGRGARRARNDRAR